MSLRFHDVRSRQDVARAVAPATRAVLPRMESLEIQTCDPLDLLSFSRVDLLIKVEYARARVAGQMTDEVRHRYLDHIAAFNAFVEADGSGKVGPDGFVAAFDSVLTDMQADGWRHDSLIPVAVDGTILDGAHRVAAAIALGVEPLVVFTTVSKGPDYSSAWFQDRGMNAEACAAGLIRWVETDVASRVALLWPAARGRADEVVGILGRYSTVLGCVERKLNSVSALQTIVAAYANEPWLGSPEDGFAGAVNKRDACFSGTEPMRVLVLRDGVDLVACKEEIRQMYGIGKHAIHITDTHRESVKMAGALLLENSLAFMQRAPIGVPKWFEELFDRYDRLLDELSIDEQRMHCLDGSAVLAAHGVRDVRDLDFLYAGPGDGLVTALAEISRHQQEDVPHKHPIDQIVLDRCLHFYFRGRKMAAPEVLISMKVKRGAPKDIEDVAMLRARLASQVRRVSWQDRLRRLSRPSYIKGRGKLLLLKARYRWTVWRQDRRR